MSPLPDALLESVAAAAVREGIADAVFTRLKSPIGTLFVAAGPRGVLRIGFAGEPEDELLAEVAGGVGPRVLRSDTVLAAERDGLLAYLEAGAPLELAHDLALVRAPFRRAVLERLAEVQRGATVGYGELAARAGRPGAARAVGTACARNPIPLVVPCHRVLPAGGGLGGYRGGAPVKARLLALEGFRTS